jgi:hypothetical protein
MMECPWSPLSVGRPLPGVVGGPQEAAACGRSDVGAYLLGRGVPLDEANDKGETALYLAAASGARHMVRTEKADRGLGLPPAPLERSDRPSSSS